MACESCGHLRKAFYLFLVPLCPFITYMKAPAVANAPPAVIQLIIMSNVLIT